MLKKKENTKGAAKNLGSPFKSSFDFKTDFANFDFQFATGTRTAGFSLPVSCIVKTKFDGGPELEELSDATVARQEAECVFQQTIQMHWLALFDHSN